jgi:hypothetical protein
VSDLLQNPALWIALAAAALVIVAHGVLFWWFLCRKGKDAKKDD